MSIKDRFKVNTISKKQAKNWILNKHYAKRLPSISYAYGLYEDKESVGVCTFGPPPRPMNNGECIFENYNVKTLELNRLITEDNLPKNALSYFVGDCLKSLPSPCCVVSYADYTFGHTGYIYQATNWIYTGLNAVHEKKIKYNGEDLHPRTARNYALRDGYSSVIEWVHDTNQAEHLGYTKKHRYLYFIGNKREKRRMEEELKYKQKPYPKGDNKEYDTGDKVAKQLSLL